MIFLFVIGQIIYGQSSTNLTRIYDGRDEVSQTKISDQEKQLIENFVRQNEKEIKKFGKSREFECEKESFRIDSVAEGFFTRKKSLQKAYLYSFCYSGQAQYATYLGGVVIVENSKPTGHYVFANIHGYNNLKSLPDLNRNGYSEITLEFHHSISGHQFVGAIKIFDLAPSGLMEVATLDIFSRLGENDIAYRIYGKRGATPIFSRETYESGYQESKWYLQQKLKKFEANPPIYSSNDLDILPITAKTVEQKKIAISEKKDQLIEIYDGRNGSKTKPTTNEDSEFVKTQVSNSEAVIKKIVESFDVECSIEPKVNQVLKGSFTQPNSAQKLYKYQLCSTSASDKFAGIIIAEAEKIVSHQIFEFVFALNDGIGVSVLPDINKNGLSEVVFAYSSGGSGLQTTEIDIQEFKSKGEPTLLGSTTAWSGRFFSGSFSEMAYRITAQSADTPIFYGEKYQKEEGEKNWKLVEKSKTFSLEKSEENTSLKVYSVEN